MRLSRYFNIWMKLAVTSFQVFFVSKISLVLFLGGKIIRFIFFLGFLFMLFSKTKTLHDYDFWHVSLFYLTFNFIDAATQMFFREVYRFRYKLLNGNFDYILLKPLNNLFHVLFAWTDFLDLLTLIPLIVLIFFVFFKIPEIKFIGIILYILFVINALVIAMSFHIFVLALAVITTEVDHAIMIYRDFTGLGKLPTDIYTEPLRSFITFVIPVGIMMNFPVKAALGNLSLDMIIIALIISLVLLLLSIKLWHVALSKYTSFSQ